MTRPTRTRPSQTTALTRRLHWPGLRALLTLLVFPVALVGTPSPAGGQTVPELQINSEQYIVIDAETGEVFAQRGANEPNAMASLTKVFTAIQAIEEAPPDYLITIDESDMPVPQASFMGFSPGDVYTLEELLYGLMLPSGNDAAHAIARSLGTESEDDTPEEAVARFVDRMNQRVQDMGLTDTHLVNPDGWGVPGHYTTVRDLAAFMRYALQYPRFVDLISSPSYTLSDGREIYNNNRLMTWYDDLLGGKTGYDNDSGWCLIEVAQRDGETMISVTFDGNWPDDWYDDNQVLLEYAFEQKADRLASGADIDGVLVSYLDPDAAVVERMAASAGSLGAVKPTEQDLAAGPAVGAGSAAVGESDGEILSGGLIAPGDHAAGTGAIAIFGVLGLIVGVRAMGTYAYPIRRATVTDSGHRRRRRRPQRRPSNSPTESPPV